ncbi:GD13363 [Drosophila simulans]|uniref:GD13363 n=1 Tax=Drosophila simulans TaxID=7240 RepID=B4QP07_DROSI|nr:GD13363 [Drosophila simulans]
MPPAALRRSVPREEKRSAKELMACVLREWTLAISLPDVSSSPGADVGVDVDADVGWINPNTKETFATSRSICFIKLSSMAWLKSYQAENFGQQLRDD